VYHIKDTVLDKVQGGPKSKPASFLITLSTASQYLQGSAVTQTVLSGLYRLHIFCSVHVPKIIKIGWQYKQSYCTIKQAHFIRSTL